MNCISLQGKIGRRFSHGLAGIVTLATVFLGACGGPGEPEAPDLYATLFTVFYDEDGDGTLDAEEVTRIAGVKLTVGLVTGNPTDDKGLVSIADVPEGTQTVSVDLTSLPPFFEPPKIAKSIVIPASGAVPVPLTLPIGNVRHHVYMAFGDSITEGVVGASDENGYLMMFQSLIKKSWGAGMVLNRGIAGQKSFRGVERIDSDLDNFKPAYTLILFGTNDWNDINTRRNFPGDTINNLQTIMRSVRQHGSLPVIGTIPPVAPYWAEGDRHTWVSEMNKLLKPMAVQEGAAVADIEAAFKTVPTADILNYFFDAIHPSDKGYKLIAEVFHQTIVKPRSGLTGTTTTTPVYLKDLVWDGWSAEEQVLGADPTPAR